VTVNAVFLRPVPITRQNLNVVLEANWIAKDRLCQGVNPEQVPVCR
jgi:D-xylose transport system substrate-binding protein